MLLSPGREARLCSCAGLSVLEQAQGTVLHLGKGFWGQSAPPVPSQVTSSTPWGKHHKFPMSAVPP